MLQLTSNMKEQSFRSLGLTHSHITLAAVDAIEEGRYHNISPLYARFRKIPLKHRFQNISARARRAPFSCMGGLASPFGSLLAQARRTPSSTSSHRS